MAVRALAEKSAKLGRIYGLAGMKVEQRAQTLKAVDGVAGLSAKVEGEGRGRRVVLTPDKIAPMPKRVLPGHDDDEDEE